MITEEAPQVRSRETSFGGGEEEATMNIKPMQPLLRGYTSCGPSIHMSCMGESQLVICNCHVQFRNLKIYAKFCSENLKRRDCCGDLCLDERIVLR